VAEPRRTRDVVDALRSLALVESASADRLATVPFAAAAVPLALDPLGEAWEPRKQIHAREALEMEPGDERVTSCIADSGIVIGHPELQRKCLAGYDCVDLGMGRVSESMRLVGDSRGYDYNPRDEVGHGCHVAGIIGAQGWRIPCGVGGRTLLLAIRVLAAAVEEQKGKRIGVGSLCDIDAGLKVAADLGADVINMSFGTAQAQIERHEPMPHENTVKYAKRNGCVLVAAAGNSGEKEEFLPAALPDVIAVSSVDRAGRRSRFSTFGKHIALCAPGERIVSTGLRGYMVNSGTSFAAPFVSGTAALLLAHARRKNRKLDGADVRKILVQSATPLGAGGFSEETGHGLLNARAALETLDRALAGPNPPGRPM
jgi:subtilisin family serine protease